MSFPSISIKKIGTRQNQNLAHGSPRINADEENEQMAHGLELDSIDPSSIRAIREHDFHPSL
jgi:hypothetical protein